MARNSFVGARGALLPAIIGATTTVSARALGLSRQRLLKTLARIGARRGADGQGIIAPHFPPRHRVCMEGRV